MSSKSERPDLALTYLAGENFCRSPMVAVYANTVRDHFRGEMVILTHEMGPRERKELSGAGFEVVDCPPPLGRDLMRYRWRVFYDFLCDRFDCYRLVLVTDSKDVIWQRDPVDEILAAGGGRDEFVVVCPERVTHRECEWNSREQRELRAACLGMQPDPADCPVLNAGCVFGTTKSIKDLAFSMHCITMLGHVPITDQGFFNLLVNDRNCDPDSPFIFANPSLVAPGNTIARGMLNAEWDQDLVDETGRPFALFHQWDRTKYRGEILSRHGVMRK